MNRSSRVRILLPILIILAMAASALSFMIIPALSAIGDVRVLISDGEKEIDEMREAVDSKSELSGMINRAEHDIRQSISGLYPYMDAEELSDLLTGMLKSHELRVSAIEAEEATDKELKITGEKGNIPAATMTGSTMNIEVHGSFKGMNDFLDTLSRNLSIRLDTVETNKEDDNGCEAAITLTVFMQGDTRIKGDGGFEHT